MKTTDLNLVDDQDETFSLVEGLARYDESAGNDQKWCTITEIVVPTEYDKDQLLRAFEYIHNLRTIDSDYLAVNTVMHMYLCPDKIKVRQ